MATNHVEEAVGTYRAALEVRTRELVPLQWAMTHYNLGISPCHPGRTGEKLGTHVGSSEHDSRSG